LYLLGAGIALAIATHELYYILFFIFGWFLLLRAAFELLPRRTTVIALAVIMGLALVVEILNPRITASVRAGGMALLFLTTAGLGLLMTRVWDEAPIVVHRATELWRERRGVLWTALAILAAIYIVMYSTFFADTPSLLTGLYAGLQYWLGSQQEFARGDQPWYYHLMMLSIYEPLALYGGVASVLYLLTRGWGRTGRGWRMEARSAVSEERQAEQQAAAAEQPEHAAALDMNDETPPEAPETMAVLPARPLLPIFPLFLAFWFVASLVAFSWAGEKMPWLTTHIALPGNLLVAWVIGRLLSVFEQAEQPRSRLALVPFFLILLLAAFGVAFWRFSTPADSQQSQAAVLQGIIPLAVGGALLYGLLTLAQRAGWRPVLAAVGLTLAGVLGVYMIRSTWLVVYDHPDTPVDPLVYVQSTPDVPLIVADIRELAINQTRNSRSAADPIGGLTMPVIMDAGDPARDGEGSLAWPYQWYFRDFKRLENRQADFFRTATEDSFMVDAPQGNGEREFAPVVMVSKSNMNDTTRTALQANYVLKYDTKLNWWYPEGYKCDPNSPG
ncbi:MAG TPA: TIGR03663 family protein, partial [Roseiflexaceae bacterium]|nr:TIGR03663 family protein [Roseiflexaceae bacterium]